MFDKHTPQFSACARRYWYEKARDMPTWFNARAHYLKLLQQQVEFYEFKKAEASLVAAAKAEVEHNTLTNNYLTCLRGERIHLKAGGIKIICTLVV